MASPPSIRNHLVHPMLVAVLASGFSPWSRYRGPLQAARPEGAAAAFYCTVGGIVGAVLAAVPGLIDYFSIDGSGHEAPRDMAPGRKSRRSCTINRHVQHTS
jgi:hypothetical protein